MHGKMSKKTVIPVAMQLRFAFVLAEIFTQASHCLEFVSCEERNRHQFSICSSLLNGTLLAEN
jgi:hypothetical protein